MLGPVIIALGSAAQQQRFLPRISSADERWCQGYSEPGAGSDLAALKIRAVREGDEYIVNGQKTWNTYGSMPTGCSAWCVPIRTRNRRRAFPSY